jgi:hypothetical protein
VLRFDAETGAFVDEFTPDDVLRNPIALALGHDDHLYVTGRENDAVLRFDGDSGEYLGVFASGGGLNQPTGLAIGPDGDLFVSSLSTNQVLRYDRATGAFEGAFASGSGLVEPGFLLFLPPMSDDCNGNEIPDSCDVGNGTSLDREANGIPDECESGTRPDPGSIGPAVPRNLSRRASPTSW